jgi:hypothetical protein
MKRYVAILDRVFLAIFAKDTVTYVEIAAVVNHGLVDLVDKSQLPHRPTVRSYEEYLDWHNPFGLNDKQVSTTLFTVPLPSNSWAVA